MRYVSSHSRRRRFTALIHFLQTSANFSYVSDGERDPAVTDPLWRFPRRLGCEASGVRRSSLRASEIGFLGFASIRRRCSL